MNQPVPTTSRSGNPALSQQHTNQDTTCATVDVVWRRSCEDFSLEQKVQLRRLLLEFQDLFATKSEGMGQTLLLQHTIDTGDAPPIRLWPLRLPLAQQEVTELIRTEMQEASLTEPSACGLVKWLLAGGQPRSPAPDIFLP
ncbi:UNVERIFIED_CONTAM: hypothetical protein FKN15_054308 [Acipenser sinensis]